MNTHSLASGYDDHLASPKVDGAKRAVAGLRDGLEARPNGRVCRPDWDDGAGLDAPPRSSSRAMFSFG